jgi:nitric oxide reductase activation protein
MQQLAQAIQKATASAPAPVNCNGKAVNAQQIQAGGASPGSGSDATAIALGAAQQAAKESVQKELDEAQMEAIRNNDQPLIHQRVRYEIHRHFPRASKKAYDKIYKEIEPYVRNLVQEMKRIFTDMNDEHLMRHLRFGPVIEATEAHRQDKRIFAKKKLPEEMPDMAICILIDMSGSMYGNKIECAKKTAILIERFASELNIPIMVAGHDVECCVNIRIFTDFLSATPEKDRYSLASITDGGCNRDGLAINICADLLSKRPEKTKLMVVISDGAPADSGYSGKAARDDIASIVKKYRRNGMMIYGAAIDQDRKHIQEIYGNDFLNIEDLRSLPKTLVRLVKRNMTN